MSDEKGEGSWAEHSSGTCGLYITSDSVLSVHILIFVLTLRPKLVPVACTCQELASHYTHRQPRAQESVMDWPKEVVM